jgi:hypothetical protein
MPSIVGDRLRSSQWQEFTRQSRKPREELRSSWGLMGVIAYCLPGNGGGGGMMMSLTLVPGAGGVGGAGSGCRGGSV